MTFEATFKHNGIDAVMQITEEPTGDYFANLVFFAEYVNAPSHLFPPHVTLLQIKTWAVGKMENPYKPLTIQQLTKQG